MTVKEPDRSAAPGKARSVIESAFILLDLVAELQPVRLVDLSAASAIPHPTVHRLLRQLVETGAVRREGSRYALGASLLRLGASVTPASRLRIAARRPMAELATITGAAVSLSADLGDGPVYLDTVDARSPARFVAKAGAHVPPETAQRRAHDDLATTVPLVDAGQVAVDHSCVAMGIPFGSSSGIAVVATLIPAPRPPNQMLAATRWAAERIGESLREYLSR
ncbi:helix-turn-helix domain-containing protein [Mycobacterium kubicae]|uniref:helix-turn-helix domain-containing protein n=1 Tax=Mycobacterium kubicae TaxID=120959 RepID=UPI00163F0722|nr:helix-turn-helix domain-containing protein [Mycobacterium kubicae]QNI07874.1 helix-turn-helix domain-containing protein [Mycobacterium kubicae]